MVSALSGLGLAGGALAGIGNALYGAQQYRDQQALETIKLRQGQGDWMPADAPGPDTVFYAGRHYKFVPYPELGDEGVKALGLPTPVTRSTVSGLQAAPPNLSSFQAAPPNLSSFQAAPSVFPQTLAERGPAPYVPPTRQEGGIPGLAKTRLDPKTTVTLLVQAFKERQAAQKEKLEEDRRKRSDALLERLSPPGATAAVPGGITVEPETGVGPGALPPSTRGQEASFPGPNLSAITPALRPRALVIAKAYREGKIPEAEISNTAQAAGLPPGFAEQLRQSRQPGQPLGVPTVPRGLAPAPPPLAEAAPSGMEGLPEPEVRRVATVLGQAMGDGGVATMSPEDLIRKLQGPDVTEQRAVTIAQQGYEAKVAALETHIGQLRPVIVGLKGNKDPRAAGLQKIVDDLVGQRNTVQGRAEAAKVLAQKQAVKAQEEVDKAAQPSGKLAQEAAEQRRTLGGAASQEQNDMATILAAQGEIRDPRFAEGTLQERALVIQALEEKARLTQAPKPTPEQEAAAVRLYNQGKIRAYAYNDPTLDTRQKQLINDEVAAAERERERLKTQQAKDIASHATEEARKSRPVSPQVQTGLLDAEGELSGDLPTNAEYEQGIRQGTYLFANAKSQERLADIRSVKAHIVQIRELLKAVTGPGGALEGFGTDKFPSRTSAAFAGLLANARQNDPNYQQLLLAIAEYKPKGARIFEGSRGNVAKSILEPAIKASADLDTNLVGLLTGGIAGKLPSTPQVILAQLLQQEKLADAYKQSVLPQLGKRRKTTDVPGPPATEGPTATQGTPEETPAHESTQAEFTVQELSGALGKARDALFPNIETEHLSAEQRAQVYAHAKRLLTPQASQPDASAPASPPSASPAPGTSGEEDVRLFHVAFRSKNDAGFQQQYQPVWAANEQEAAQKVQQQHPGMVVSHVYPLSEEAIARAENFNPGYLPPRPGPR